MDIVKQAAMYFLGFKPYVMLPVIIFILALIFRIKLRTAITSAFTIGIGFIGIFIVFDYFVAIINPVIQNLIKRTGLNLNVLDAGWPPLAAITWSFAFAPVFIILVMAVNIILLITKLTKTINIDIWNYWHFIFTGALVYNVTQNIFLSSLATVIICVITLKIADWSAPLVNKFSGMEGISIPTLSAATYFPFGILGNKLIDKMPFVNKIDANPEKMKEKIGLAGEPMIIGFVIGILLGIGGGYDTRKIAELAFGIAAVIYILPKMANIVGSSLIPISEGMKGFIKKRFPGIGGTYIALDVAVLVGIPSVVVTAILLMPVALILSFTLPGVKFIPLGDLVNIMGSVALVCAATRGNVIRSFLIGIPIVVIHLYTASNMAHVYTKLAGSVNYKLENYSGTFTSFLDGGNVIRVWVVKLFVGNTYALLLIPVFILIFYLTRKIAKRG
ncbi:MAG TPA: PTS transporter subunit IIC [Pseudobacteroides sp.]|uniref:PTS transporter subunit IIC n=1 Tax=Pseudobacteroides sp. TaxID=1968840 RepID=UPI002F942C96